ncbi:MAG TPA: hypothetical protein VI248_25560 [Kineosporiaceae bacterium]
MAGLGGAFLQPGGERRTVMVGRVSGVMRFLAALPEDPVVSAGAEVQVMDL